MLSAPCPSACMATSRLPSFEASSVNLRGLRSDSPIWPQRPFTSGQKAKDTHARLRKSLWKAKDVFLNESSPPCGPCKRNINRSLVLTILHSKDTALYNCVKQVCDVRCGVRNVNVLAEKFKGANDQYSANVGLKINLKLGGSNQSLQKSDLGFFAEGRTMLVGIDVTHPSPGSARSAPSIAGIVASVDSALAQWPAEIRIQAARQEMVADLDVLLQSRLRHWACCNRNALPENIVVYRDGVSKGQYDAVIEQELPLLKRACEAVYPADQTKQGRPRLAVIVVGKRHNTRFYPTRDADADRAANPMPGTVVDRAVSDPRLWDFYLQAQRGASGHRSARPLLHRLG